MTIRQNALKGYWLVNVLIDTNVILDVLCNRTDFVEASAAVLKYCEVKEIQGYVSALSFPNIVYIMRKELTNEKIKEIINTLSLILTVADLKASDLKKAADLDFNDFEDALQAVCASKVQAQYIVTRNIKDFQNSKIPAIKPAELLERL